MQTEATWDTDNLLKFIDLLQEFGWGRWEHFKMACTQSVDCVKVGVRLLRTFAHFSTAPLLSAQLLRGLNGVDAREYKIAGDVFAAAVTQTDLAQFFEHFELALSLSEVNRRIYTSCSFHHSATNGTSMPTRVSSN
jgi:hypothetical protein